MKLLLLMVFLLCFSCKKTNNKNTALLVSELDSIEFYFNLGKNKSKNELQRLSYITKAYNLCRTSKEHTLRLKILSYKTQRHSALKQYDSAIYYAHCLNLEAKRAKDTLLQGRAYFKLGLYFDRLNQSDSAYYHYNTANKIFTSLNDFKRSGRSLLNMAIIQSDKGDFVGSDETAISALTALQNTTDSASLASVQNCLAITARKLEQYSDAIYRYNEAIKITPKIYNKLIYACNKANAYTKQNQFNTSIAILDSINNIDFVNSKPILKARILDNRAYAIWKNNKKAKVINDFEKAYNLRLQNNDYYGLIASNAHFIEYYEEVNPTKTYAFAINMYNVAAKVKSVKDKLTALKHLSLMPSLDPISTKKYSNEYIYLNDSLNSAYNKAKNQFIKVKYENQKNREDNYKLMTENIQKQLELERSNKVKTIILFAFILFVLISYFIFRQRKLKHKREKIKEVLKAEAQISKKVHDEVANEVYQLMSKIQSKVKVNFNELLDQLENIYLKTRDISKSITIIDVKSNYPEQLQDLFLSYQSEETKIISGNMTKINWKSISKSTKITLYRVLQELLTNMKKHSKASVVYINFSQSNTKLIIKYADNGIGCNLSKGNGIQSMENRMDSINGQIKFETKIANGFKVLITI